MVFCSKCGEKLPEDAYFCPRCGIRTKMGIEAGISTPWEDLRDTLSRIMGETERALSVAGREVERAFGTARKRIREATSRQPIVCSHCQKENIADAGFCFNCGKKLH